MKAYFGHIEQDTSSNENFRKVVHTGKFAQVVLMSLKKGEEIGLEVHPHVDQFFRFEQGQGRVVVDAEEFAVEDGDSVMVPAGSQHNVINTGEGDLKLYTIYSPPNHPDGTVHKTKAEADAAEAKEHHS
ncbi:MAG: cupin domain-containing protein [Patescibacteria group bacterium]|nr:cupin domain-containing protein [Patescibacteria group bacterium]